MMALKRTVPPSKAAESLSGKIFILGEFKEIECFFVFYEKNV